MDKGDRQRILDNVPVLKNVVKFEDLLPKLRESGIFHNEMLLDIELAGPTNEERLDMLFKFLPKRGPQAFHKFITCLNLSEHYDAANLLNDADVWDGRVRQSSTIYFGNGNNDVYLMKAQPRGVALILSYEDFNGIYPTRFGGEIDVEELHQLFLELGFVVEIHNNLSCEDTKKTILAFTMDERHISANATVVCCLSHGAANGFYCSDGELICTEWMLTQFNNTNCTNLHSKPKIFFLQHCRGEEIDHAIEADGIWHTDSIGEKPATILPRVEGKPSLATWSDMKICYSTSKKKVSFRSKESGTFFIKVIVEVFRRRAHNTHLDDMLKEVTANMLKSEIQGCKQSTELIERGWQRNLFFNPGL